MEARSGGHEFYGDIFERASILLQTYAFDELMQGIAEGFSSIREKNRSTDYSSLNNKKGYVNLSDDSDSQLNEMLNKSTYFHTNVDCSEIATDFFNSIGGQGEILHIESKEGILYIEEYGNCEKFYYHEVYSLNGMIYDPRYANVPVNKSEYFAMVSNLNEGGFTVWTIDK